MTVTPLRLQQTGGGDVRMSGLLLLALAIATSSVASVLTGSGWWLAAFGVMFVVFTVGAVARYYLRRRWIGTVAAVVAAIIVITVFFAANSAFLGFIPTGGVFEQFGQLTAAANDSIARQSIPAVATVGIQFLVCWSIAGIAVVMDAVAIWWRAPALTGVPLLAVVIIPSFILASLSNAFTFEFTAVAYLLIVVGRRFKVRPGVAVSVGVIAVLGALVLPVALPPVSPGESNGSGIGVLAESINPIINLGSDLRRSVALPALTYTTTSDTGEYLRLTTLDNFSGKQWEPATPKLVRGNTVSHVGDAPGLGKGVKTTKVATSIQVAATTGVWLPVPYPAVSIKGLKGDWFWQSDTLAIRSNDSSMEGQRYTVDSLDVEPTIQQLEAAPSSSNSPLARVPAGLNPIVAATAKKVVGDAKTDFDKAVALQNWFRDGTFKYSTKTPVAAGFDGSGLDVIVPFLKAKSGYCVHFATTMAVMARTLGIPSRVAVGFLPGKATRQDQSHVTVYTVSSSDLHAWPELYFKGIGWVRFEPTPGKGFEPNFPDAPGSSSSTDTTGSSSSAPTSTPTSVPVKAPHLPGQDADSQQSALTSPASVPTASLGGIGVLLLLLLIVAPAVIRIGSRRRRLDRIRQSLDPAELAWQELRDTARDLGIDARETATPGQLTALLASYLAAVPRPKTAAIAALNELRDQVEDEAYGLPEYRYVGEKMADNLVLVLRGLRSATPLGRRTTATLVPPTLVDRALGRRFARA